MNILHIDSSASGAASVSRELTAAAVQALLHSTPLARVNYRDLVAQAPAHLDADLLQSLRPTAGSESAPTPGLQTEIAYTDILLEEFLAADVIVVGAPMYNFSIPSQLKAWIDRIAQAGKTFRYTSQGAEGLAGGKKVLIVSSRGGKYAGTPLEGALDHQEAYLRGVFGFFGITDVQVLRAEGLNMGAETRAQAIAEALAQTVNIASRRAA